MPPVRIAVTCGYSKSLHAIALLHALRRQGHEVRLCLEVGAWNAARIRFYVRQIGWQRFVRKVRARLWARDRASGVASEVLPMRQFLSELGVHASSVAQACREVGATHARVPGLNHPRSLDALRQAGVDLVVYAGGGILRADFLRIPPKGVLNAHAAPLPAFRGMNSTEWALLYGVKPVVAVIQVDTGVDTGPILYEKPIPTAVCPDIASLRGVATRVSVEALLETVAQLNAGTLAPRPQEVQAGRQFFVMTEPLLELVEKWLRHGLTPCIDATHFSFTRDNGSRLATGSDTTT